MDASKARHYEKLVSLLESANWACGHTRTSLGKFETLPCNTEDVKRLITSEAGRLSRSNRSVASQTGFFWELRMITCGGNKEYSSGEWMQTDKIEFMVPLPSAVEYSKVVDRQWATGERSTYRESWTLGSLGKGG